MTNTEVSSTRTKHRGVLKFDFLVLALITPAVSCDDSILLHKRLRSSIFPYFLILSVAIVKGSFKPTLTVLNVGQ